MADTEVAAGSRQSVFGDGGNALFEREEPWLLSVAISIGDTEDTGLETKPHWYEPLAPEDASHGAVGRLDNHQTVHGEMDESDPNRMDHGEIVLFQNTGAKIIIRGKGSVKEGKIGRKDGQPLPGEDEPLHAYITASNPDNVKKAVDKINEIIRQGIEVPEGQNDLRRQQLRELAQLNGTLRENDALSKLKQIQQAQSIITNTIFCSVCGGTGHLSQDCKQKRPGDSFRQMNDTPPPSNVDKAKMDSEYMSLMAELGEGPPPPKQQAPPPRSVGGHMGGMHGRGDFHGPPGNSGHLGPPGGRGGPFGGPGMGPPGHMGPQGGHFNQGPPGQHGGPPISQHQHLSGGPPKQLQLPPPNNPVPPLMSQNPVPSLMSQTSQPQQRPPTSQMPPGLMSQSSQPPPLVPPPVLAPLSSGAPWSQQQNITTTSQSQMGMPPPPPGMIAPPPPPPVSMASQSQPSFPWQQAMQQQQQQQQQGMGMPPPPPPTSSSATMSPWQQGHVGPVPPPPPNSMAPWQQSAPPGPVPPVAPPPPPPGSQGYNPNSGHNYGMPLGVPPPPPPN